MPGFLLHVGATVQCAHGGQAQPNTPNPRVRVAGQPTVTLATPYTIAGCPFTTPGGPLPCVAAQYSVGATRVRSGGQPLLLQDSQALTVPNGVPLNAAMTQTRVKGI